MDQIMQHDIQMLKQFSKLNIEKKAIKIIISISVFSLLFSNISLLPLLLHSLNNCITTISMELFSYTADRHCVFLLCNGILVFLIKNSKLIGNSPPGTGLKDCHSEKHCDAHQSIPLFLEAKEAEEEENPAEVQEDHGRRYGILITAEDIEKWLLTSEGGDEEDEQEDDFLSVGEEEEEGIGLLSAEELNKKCEDFIKKMKEGIKIEAQAHSQQILIV